MVSEKQIKDLFNMEKMLEMNLHNCNFHLKGYLDKMYAIDETRLSALQLKEKERFVKFFLYYSEKLIPALDEILEMDKRHGEIIGLNPDSHFSPIAIEFKNHKKLMEQFFGRFSTLHREFHAFTKAISR